MFRYSYNASAVAVGGVIDEDFGRKRTVIPSLASVALAPTGGRGVSSERDFKLDGILSFSYAESRVVGTQVGDNVYTTYSDVLITDVLLFNRLKIALMGVKITTTRDTTTRDPFFEVNAFYRGVELDGEDIEPCIDVDLCKLGTYDAFCNYIASNVDRYATQFNAPKEKLRDAANAKNDPIHGAFVEKVERGSSPALVASGSKLLLPELGLVQFGELLVKRGRRRVNLLRLDFGDQSFPSTMSAKSSGGGSRSKPMGPPYTGSMTLGSGEGNGVPIWP